MLCLRAANTRQGHFPALRPTPRPGWFRARPGLAPRLAPVCFGLASGPSRIGVGAASTSKLGPDRLRWQFMGHLVN